MSEQPQRPEQPGVETHVPKDVVAGLQAALDATFNAAGGSDRDQVERHLREQLQARGVGGGVSEQWVDGAVDRLAAGEPVVAEPDDA